MASSVTFRKFKDNGEIIALFPTVKNNWDGSLILSYMHEGQHGSASMDILGETKPATASEYNDLLIELENIGYDDLPVKSIPA